MRTFARHIAGVIVGLFAATLISMLEGFGIDPGEAAGFIEHLTSMIEVAMLVVGYFVTEKLLKRFKLVDPGAWAEKVWKDKAAEEVQPLGNEVAARKIERGEI